MTDLLKYNTSQYHNSESVKYLKNDSNHYHVLRIKMALDLIEEEVNKDSPQNRNNLKLLSLGCADGFIEEKIKNQLGIQVYGLEASKNCAEEAIKKGIKISIGDISKKFPYENKSFDFVFAGEVIEHIIDTRHFLNEIKRILKPGGFLILTTPNLARLDDRIKFIFGKAPRHTNPMHKFLYLHIRPFTFSSLKGSLEKTNFKLISFKSNFVVLDIKNKQLRSRLLAKIFPSWGGSLIIKAQS